MLKSKSITNAIIGQFQFILTPVSVWFQSQEKSPDMRLYIEKGMQIIGKINQVVEYPTKKQSKQRKFFFSTEQLNKKSFRIYNQQSMTYQWSLYEIQDDGGQNFLDSAQFNISKAWKDYSQWYQNKASDMSSQIRQKDNQKIAQKWKQLKKTAENKQIKYMCQIQKRKIKIQFLLQIKNQYDSMLQEYEKEKERKIREKQQRIFMRSTLMPMRNSLGDSNDKLSRAELTRSEYPFFRADSNDNTKSFHHKHQTFPQSHKVSFNSESVEIEQQKKSKSKLLTKPSDSSSQMLKNQSKILSEIKQDNQTNMRNSNSRSRSKIAFVQNNNNIQQEKHSQKQQAEDNQIPLIRVQSNTQKIQEKNQQRQSRNKQVINRVITITQKEETPIQSSKKDQIGIKTILLYTVFIVVMSFLVYRLMLPNRRI